MLGVVLLEFGLLGGGHCLGMCGGLMGALTLAIPKEQRSRRFRLLLATNDLEIRGAGELLGDGQSGQIQAVGFTLYMEMLERAVQAVSGERLLARMAPHTAQEPAGAVGAGGLCADRRAGAAGYLSQPEQIELSNG